MSIQMVLLISIMFILFIDGALTYYTFRVNQKDYDELLESQECLEHNHEVLKTAYNDISDILKGSIQDICDNSIVVEKRLDALEAKRKRKVKSES